MSVGGEEQLVALTYRELAERLGVSIFSARGRARRRAAKGEWRILPGNHPLDPVRVELSIEALRREAKEAVQKPARAPGGDGAVVEALLRELGEQRARLDYLSDLLFNAKDVLVATHEKLRAREAELARVEGAREAERRAAAAALLAVKEELIRLSEGRRHDLAELAEARTRESRTAVRLERAVVEGAMLRRQLNDIRRGFWRRWFGR